MKGAMVFCVRSKIAFDMIRFYTWLTVFKLQVIYYCPFKLSFKYINVEPKGSILKNLKEKETSKYIPIQW